MPSGDPGREHGRSVDPRPPEVVATGTPGAPDAGTSEAPAAGAPEAVAAGTPGALYAGTSEAPARRTCGQDCSRRQRREKPRDSRFAGDPTLAAFDGIKVNALPVGAWKSFVGPTPASRYRDVEPSRQNCKRDRIAFCYFRGEVKVNVHEKTSERRSMHVLASF